MRWECAFFAISQNYVRIRAKLILFGEASLKRALTEFQEHYPAERNHQGKGNKLLFPRPTPLESPLRGRVRCQERLGGLLKYYEREAA